MKYLVSLAIFALAILGTATAQESAAELKNAGNAAYKVKDYAKALISYEKAIEAFKVAGEEDNAVVYNAAFCARKLKKYDKALSLYKITSDKGYKGDASAYYVGYCYNKLDKDSEMESVLLSALSKYKSSKYLSNMKKLLVTYYLKQGAEPYSKGIEILNTRSDSNRDKWDTIKETAVVEFEKSKAFMNKALEYDALNETAKSTLSKIEESLKN